MSLLVEATPVAEELTSFVPSVLSVEQFWARATAEPCADEIVIDGTRYRPHPNGGGLVAVTAFVGSGVFVAETARVSGRAIVLDAVRLLDRAVVSGNAVVADRCELRGESRVEGFATVLGKATLRRRAHIDGTARLEGMILVDYVAHISHGHLVGPLSIG